MDKLLAKLAYWESLSKKLVAIKAEEFELRKELFGEYFDDPKEGINSYPLSNDYVLKGTYSLNRKVNEKALPDIAKKPGMKTVLKNVLKYKPELVKSEYNKLPDDKKKIFDNALIVKPGAPKLEIVLPKRKG